MAAAAVVAVVAAGGGGGGVFRLFIACGLWLRTIIFERIPPLLAKRKTPFTTAPIDCCIFDCFTANARLILYDVTVYDVPVFTTPAVVLAGTRNTTAVNMTSTFLSLAV